MQLIETLVKEINRSSNKYILTLNFWILMLTVKKIDAYNNQTTFFVAMLLTLIYKKCYWREGLKKKAHFVEVC